MSDGWNELLKASGQPILHDVSLQALKQVFHKGIPGHDNNHLPSYRSSMQVSCTACRSYQRVKKTVKNVSKKSLT